MTIRDTRACSHQHTVGPKHVRDACDRLRASALCNTSNGANGVGQSAVELCDIGALKQLLSLMETHWKQLGQVRCEEQASHLGPSKQRY